MLGYGLAASLHYWRRALSGSIGLALKRKRLANHVVGVGRSITKLDTAIQRGAIDQATDDILVGAKNADLVIACTPVQSIVDSLLVAASVASPDAILTDVGSTKSTIIRDAVLKLSPNNYIGAIRSRVGTIAVSSMQ